MAGGDVDAAVAVVVAAVDGIAVVAVGVFVIATSVVIFVDFVFAATVTEAAMASADASSDIVG